MIGAIGGRSSRRAVPPLRVGRRDQREPDCGALHRQPVGACLGEADPGRVSMSLPSARIDLPRAPKLVTSRRSDRAQSDDVRTQAAACACRVPSTGSGELGRPQGPGDWLPPQVTVTRSARGCASEGPAVSRRSGRPRARAAGRRPGRRTGRLARRGRAGARPGLPHDSRHGGRAAHRRRQAGGRASLTVSRRLVMPVIAAKGA
jgi:hypothetical protein